MKKNEDCVKHHYCLKCVQWSVGGALMEMGESMKRLAEVKDSLDIDVKQNFIDPFQTIVDKDLRDIQVKH